MNAITTMPDILPASAVFVRDGVIYTTSQAVADAFEKQHRDVLRSIDHLIEQEPSLALRNFAQGVYTLPETGQQQHRSYDLTRDGFVLLAMGFTGAKALQFKLAVLAAFNRMEAELQTRSPRDLGPVREVLLHQADRIRTLKANALNRIPMHDGSLGILDAAAVLQISSGKLFGFMRRYGWIYLRPNSAQPIAYQKRIRSGALINQVTTVALPDGDKVCIRTARVTAQGLFVLMHELRWATGT